MSHRSSIVTIGYNLSSDLGRYSSSGTNASGQVSQKTTGTNGGIYGIAAQVDDQARELTKLQIKFKTLDKR